MNTEVVERITLSGERLPSQVVRLRLGTRRSLERRIDRLVQARRVGLVALAAGVTWSALSIDSIVRPDPERYRDALMVIPLGLTLVGIVVLHALQRKRLGRLGRLGFGVTVAAMLASLIGQSGMAGGIEGLSLLAFPAGLIVWTVGMALFGIATARAGAFAAWMGVALALAEPLAVAAGLALSPIVPLSDYGSYSGAIAHGIVWLAIGVALSRDERAG